MSHLINRLIRNLNLTQFKDLMPDRSFPTLRALIFLCALMMFEWFIVGPVNAGKSNGISQLEILDKTPVIHLSSDIAMTWGGDDYLVFVRLGSTEEVEASCEAIDSVLIELTNRLRGEMHDDGMHLDNLPEDGIYGYYELIDWETIEYYPALGIGYNIDIYCRAYIYGILAEPGVKFSGPLAIPKLLSPAYGDTITGQLFSFHWESVPDADGYAVIVWLGKPMIETLQRNVIWQKFIDDSTVTQISVPTDTLELVQGMTYYWAVWAYDTPEFPKQELKTASMEWGFFTYNLDTTRIDIPHGPNIPSTFELSQNYPNPFNSETRIVFQLPKDCSVTIQLFDILGHEIKTFVNAQMKTGVYSVIWKGEDSSGSKVPSGVYFYRITAGELTETKRMLLLK